MMRYRNLILGLGVLTAMLVGCRSYTYKLTQGDPERQKLGLSFAKEDRMEEKVDSLYKTQLPEYMELVGDDGKVQRLVQSVMNEDGTSSPLFELKEVQVVARNRNIAERNGVISMDFVVTVPKPLINRKWQLRVYPRAFKRDADRLDLEPIVLSGADFLKMQKEGYEQYKRFIASIVPDSLYWKEMIDRKGVKQALADLEQEYYKAWQKEVLTKDEWIDWRDKVNKRYLLFNKKMERNRASVDSTSVLTILPSYWLERQLNKRVVPASFAEYAWGNKEIVKKRVTPADSIEIERKYTNIKKIAENERRREQKEAMYNKLVKFPKIASRLDTIIEGDNDFKYFYTQEIEADAQIKKIKLVLNGEVVAIDMSTYEVPKSDTLTYFVSAMVDFLDENPRYKTQIVYRNEEKSVQAKIDFKVGSSAVDPKMGNNAKELERVRLFADDIERIGDFILDSLTLVGYASPEGPQEANRSLSERRTAELKRYVVAERMFKHLPKVQSRAGGENWGGLARWVVDSAHLLTAGAQKGILESISKYDNMDQREAHIRQAYPSDYGILKERCYPELRTTEFRFYTHRANMVKDTIHTSVIDERYNEGRELLRSREYKKALEILSAYERDFNLAICQMSLGYNKPALEILERYCDRKNADVQYLLSILYMRENRPKEALEMLFSSTKVDRRKIYRAQMDPELNKLIKQYNLFSEELNF